MRKLFTLLLVICLTSCKLDFRPPITGDGNVIEKEVSTGPFNGISVSGGLDVVIYPSDTQKIIIVADKNIVDFIEVKVSGNDLKISPTRTILTARSKMVEVYSRQIVKIDASSAAKVTSSDTIKSDQFKIISSSAAEVLVSCRFKRLEIEASSAAKIKVEGETEELKANVSSAADLHAYDLRSENANVWASSASLARVYVTHTANLHASSAANIKYDGDPVIKNIESSSGSNVEKR